MFVQTHDEGEFIEETGDCDSQSAIAVANRICNIYLDTLTVAPYNLVVDESVRVKIIAQNDYGESDFSEIGNGAVIKLRPDAPINLANDPLITSAFTIAFTWEEGPFDGSTPVLDFDIYYDKAINDWVLLETGVPTLYYQTTVDLINDQIYTFKVMARNSVGYSPLSETISIRAARVPDVPLYLVNVPTITTAYQIGVAW